MVAALISVAIVSLSRLAATSRSGGHRFKTEGAPHFPLSPLLPLLLPLELSCSFSVFLLARGARAKAWTCRSCRARARVVRCGEEAFFPTRRPQRGGSSRGEVVTVAWDPHPREPVEGVLWATSVLELAATRRTLELRGKRWLGQWHVSHLQSSRGWSGTPRTVRSSPRRRPSSPSSHCLTPCGPGTTWRGETSQQRQSARRAEETGR
ncbi:hypothetical protein Taro_027845 [Colocasia esculenta]|uniref:Uncharacterized protein n=1 Tax=Colocasia esculenta TaxID=4460 RepID=A0A843VGV1_COLES|nr:hypothetical protein [Colocasia esculenta]